MENISENTAMNAFQDKQIAFLEQGNIDGLLSECYDEHARFHSFDFKLNSHTEIREMLLTYLEILSSQGARTITKFETGSDYIWMEMTIQNPNGAEIKVYELKFIRFGKIYLQLFGVKEGDIWPEDFLRKYQLQNDQQSARQFHGRYLTYHEEGDADGLADEFFTEDARLSTARVNVSGREAIRTMFKDLFSKESDFTPLSVQNITSDTDYVWFEATVASNLGERKVYDAMLIRDGKVFLQLVGQLRGVMPTEAAFNK